MEQAVVLPEGALARHADQVLVAIGAAPDFPRHRSSPAQGATASTLFQGAAWLASWNRHAALSGARTPVRVVALKGDRMVLDLPLVLEARRGIRSLVWQCDDLNDYCGPVAGFDVLAQLSEAEARELLSRAAAAIGGVDFVRLEKQLPFYDEVRNPFVGSGSIPYHVKAHAVRWHGSWDAHYAASRGAKTRRRLKEKLQALRKRGEVVLRLSGNEAEAKNLVARALDMKAVQLRKLGHWNALERPPARAHVIDFFGEHCRDEAWVAVLELDRQPLAIAFGFRDAKGWLLYQIAMEDGPHARFSPGTHLLMFLMRTCGEAGVTSLDLSLGDEPYKQEWCNITQQLMNDVFPLSPRGAVAAALLRLVYRIRLAIVARPRVYVRAKLAKRWLLGTFGSLPG